MQTPAEEAIAPARSAPAPEWLAVGETLLLAAGVVAVGMFLNRADPFMLRRGFPWVALAPILAGLRYGSLKALVGAMVLDAALVTAWRAGLALPPTAVEAAAGWTVAGLISGEFGDAWRRRARALEAAVEARRRQAEALWRTHLALQASYERVRSLAPSETASLSEALAGIGDALRTDLATRTLGEVLGAHGGQVLELLAQHAYVQAGSLHVAERDGRIGPAVAVLGKGSDHERDQLVVAAVASGAVESVRERGAGSALLAAVPLVDADGLVHGIIAIRDMPFVALHDDTLRLLAVIGGSLGESLAQTAHPLRGPQAARNAGVAAGSRAFAARAIRAAEAGMRAVISKTGGLP